VAVLLAGWCLLTALIFHRQFSDLDQLMNFFKNLTMAGGFLWLAKADLGRACRRPVGGRGSLGVNHADDEGGGDL
jgi:uncharacterized membrane protein YphA (DoxX/SURF4 family)